MKAIILAARKSTRLLPLTKEIPQCLLKIGNKTILEIQIENLKKTGIEDIMVITGHLTEKVEKFCQRLGVSTLFDPFYAVSWMALALWVVKEELKEDFIFLYSDVLFEPKIIQELLENKNDICLAIKKEGIREEAEKVVEENELIKNISKDRITGENGEYIGIAKFSSLGSEKLVEELNNVARVNLNASFIEVIDNLIKKGKKIASYDIKDAKFIDIDFIEDLERARIYQEKRGFFDED